MHNAAFAALGIDAVYGTFDTTDANDFWTLADGLRIAGASVTAPMKREMRSRLREVDDIVERIGVVNTLRGSSNGWEGRNFDVAGFLAPLRPHADALRGRRAVVLGAGGAARAAIFGLQSIGAHVALSARRSVAAAHLATEFKAETIEWPPQPGWDVLVNTTPVGTWPRVEASPLERDLVRGPLVYDLVYNPGETQLMKWARAAGAETIGGLSMLVAQAAAQFEWWTGQPAPVDVMRQAAEEFLLKPEA
jgi:shikimate dehydrogenase